jgi:hypothetical protein
LAADAINAALRSNDTSASRLGTWGQDYIAGMDRMRRLVVEFYEGLNFGQFVKRHSDQKGLVTDLLIGELFKPEVDQLWPLIDAMRAEQAAMAAPPPATAVSMH